jgi:hypothetical protein
MVILRGRLSHIETENFREREREKKKKKSDSQRNSGNRTYLRPSFLVPKPWIVAETCRHLLCEYFYNPLQGLRHTTKLRFRHGTWPWKDLTFSNCCVWVTADVQHNERLTQRKTYVAITSCSKDKLNVLFQIIILFLSQYIPNITRHPIVTWSVPRLLFFLFFFLLFPAVLSISFPLFFFALFFFLLFSGSICFYCFWLNG